MKPGRAPIRDRRTLRRIRYTLLIASFLAIIYLPGIGMILRPQEAASQKGREESRAMPKLTWRLSSIVSYPKDFGEYFRFNFGFRQTLIHWHTKFAGEALDQSSSPMVVEGKQGWLFYGEPRTVDDYRGLLPFTPEQLQQWQQALEQRRDWLAAQGIPFLFVVCPDKHTIYPEYMPDRLNRVHDQTRLDQLMAYMKKHSTVEILDLRPTLWEWKTRYLCYQPQETHWNGVGAFAGYQRIAKRLRQWYPDLRVLELDECVFYQRQNPDTDLLRLQGKEDTLTVMDGISPTQPFEARIWTDANDVRASGSTVLYSHRETAPIPRVLMICDSFSTYPMPFLAEHFADARYIWGGGDGFDPQDVLDWQPDIVIQELVERGLSETKLNILELPPVPSS